MKAHTSVVEALFPDMHTYFSLFSTSAPPVFTHPERMEKKDLTRPMRSIVRLRCKASGKPKPQIIWYKDGEIMPEEDLGLEDRSKQAWILRLTNVKEQDSGEYMCEVFNKYGKINATYMLQVIGTNLPGSFLMFPVKLHLLVIYLNRANTYMLVLIKTGDVCTHEIWYWTSVKKQWLPSTHCDVECQDPVNVLHLLPMDGMIKRKKASLPQEREEIWFFTMIGDWTINRGN